jgi:guanylate kinase
LVILIGHSASGKDTIMNKIVELKNLKPVISYATRPIREGEVNGIAYNFISEEEFQEKLKSNFFIETSNYRGWNYGMAKTDCGEDRIVVVDPCGFRTLRREGIKTISFFIDVPERERLMRLAIRGDDITELCRRIISDRDTFRGIEHEVDCVIKNKNIKVAAFEIIQELKRRMILC